MDRSGAPEVLTKAVPEASGLSLEGWFEAPAFRRGRLRKKLIGLSASQPQREGI